MDSLDGLEEEEVLKRLGEPKTVRVRSKFDGRLKHDVPHAPQYLVFPVDFRNVDAGLIHPRARVIDFGRAVDLAITRPRVCIPTAYKAPEAVFDNDSSTAIDMWSLGCTLYEIRFSRRLFHWRHDEDKRSYNCAYLDMLGPVLGMPPGDWGMYYGSREEISPGVRNPSPVPQGEEERHRSIMRELRTCSDCHNALRHDCMCIGPEPVFVSRPEAVALADLLGRLLRYQWQYRPHPARILNHYWFTTQFADP